MNARVVRILLVEDSPSDRELTGLAFKRARIANQLTTAEDGEHALEVLAEASELPDLILLDLNMPGMDGRELLKHLKADPKYASIPVVILTSSVNETDVAQAYQNHCAGYIRKPVDLAGLSQVVQAIEGYWFAIVEPVNGDGI